jgi:hypothetical protein
LNEEKRKYRQEEMRGIPGTWCPPNLSEGTKHKGAEMIMLMTEYMLQG